MAYSGASASNVVFSTETYRCKKSAALELLWLELTEQCNLECIHCYASSSPHKGHGSMTEADWLRVVRDASELGCNNLVLIGGEPTLHPSFETIIREAKSACVRTEVFSNLLSVSQSEWDLFSDCDVSLATSFYTADTAAHDRVTQRAGSYRRTLTNIERAVRKKIPLRVGLIKASDTDDEEAACDLLRSVGVTNIGFDRVRGVGRGGQTKASCVDELCGACADNRLAIVPDGSAYPCVFSRWLPVGNVRQQSLLEIVSGDEMLEVTDMLTADFSKRVIKVGSCNPNNIPPDCSPTKCNPDGCQTG